MPESLKELKHEWYQKLESSGFEDIEDTNRHDYPLKDWHNLKFLKANPDQMTNKSHYFHQASLLLHSHKFLSITHKIIWDFHCQGFSQRKIEAILHKYGPIVINGISISSGLKKYKRQSIQNIINSIAKQIK